jgi:proteic killer suppression protein
MEAAPDERTLRNWKSLEYKILTGKQKGLRQIRVNQYRIRFALDLNTNPPTATIVFIGDPH